MIVCNINNIEMELFLPEPDGVSSMLGLTQFYVIYIVITRAKIPASTVTLKPFFQLSQCNPVPVS